MRIRKDYNGTEYYNATDAAKFLGMPNSTFIYFYDKRNQLSDQFKPKYHIFLGKKIWWMQESTTWIYQDKPLHLQIWHYNTISDCDAILSENDTDWSYYKGHWPDKPVYTIPTLMIEDTLLGAREVEREDKTMMGGNFVSWYGGFDSYMISRLFENPIYQPSMRSIDGEDQLVNVLPHMQFVDWIYKLAEFKYAVHLMPSITAGTFVLNCVSVMQNQTHRDYATPHWV